MRLCVEQKTITLKGMNGKEMARYIVNIKEKTGNLEPVRNLLPYRAKKGGCTPGMKKKEIFGEQEVDRDYLGVPKERTHEQAAETTGIQNS